MNVAAYLRVSTQGQADHGFGLDVQRETIAEWTEANGHTIVAECQDVTSGANGLDERVGLAEAIQNLAAGDAQAIVVARYDRVARDLVQQELILREIARHDGEVLSCASGEANLGDDDGDPSRKLIRQILGAVAEYEKALIVARMKRGRMAKAARGGFSTGSPPFGWRSDGHGELEQDPEEQATIELVVGLRREGRSLRAIADQLNEWRKPPKRGHGFRWHPGGVARVLDRAEQAEKETT